MCQHWGVADRAYHHGDLRRALIDTGMSMLRAEGPSALTAREATRELGVSVSALYRHFESVEQWRADVSTGAREDLARSMLRAMADSSPSRSPSLAARRRFRAAGRGYVQFAIDEPNLFAGAFMQCDAVPSSTESPSAWEILETSLDQLAETGAMDPRLRADASVVAWTAVHGIGALIVQGALPIDSADDDRVSAVLDGVARALGISLDGVKRDRT